MRWISRCGDATRQGCENRVVAQNRAAFSCNFTSLVEMQKLPEISRCLKMPACVNVIMTSVEDLVLVFVQALVRLFHAWTVAGDAVCQRMDR